MQLSLELEEINSILETLGEQPYSKVYGLIAKIRQQAEAQLAEPEPKPQLNIHPIAATAD